MSEQAEALTAEQKRKRMAPFAWFHTLDLGDGVVTPGAKRKERLEFEADHVFRLPIAGQSVLDVGCWDGHFTFEARRRGATRVVGADHFVWGGPGWGNKGAFDLARACIDPAVEAQEIDIDEMTVDTVGRFGTVLLLGVFNHLKNPYGAIERLAGLADNMMVVETHIEAGLGEDAPAMRLYPTNELNGDASSWWGPNIACIEAMLKTCGFAKIERDEAYAAGSASRMLFHAIR